MLRRSGPSRTPALPQLPLKPEESFELSRPCRVFVLQYMAGKKPGYAVYSDHAIAMHVANNMPPSAKATVSSSTLDPHLSALYD